MRLKKKNFDKELNQQAQLNPSSFHDFYKVALLVDGVVEHVMDINLGLMAILLSNPTFLNASNKEYKIGEKVE
jgi:hypothetical protein